MAPLIAAAAPIIKALLANGLSTLAGAVMSKGQEWVEEKTGLDLSQAPKATHEQLLAMKQAEMKHEEVLIQAGIENRKLDLQEFTAILGDVDSARKREAAIATSENAPLINKVITPILALVVTIGGGFMLATSTDGDTKMAIVGLMTLVLGYYFGTSIGSTKASQLFRDVARKNGSS